MTIEECFKQNNYVEAVFDPIPSFDGYWTFSIDNLFENSLMENNKSLFGKFYEETYQKPMLNIFHNSNILKVLPFMVSLPNENKIGRCLKYSEQHFYSFIIGLLNQNVDKYKRNKEEQKAFIESIIAEYQNGRERLNEKLVEAIKIKCERLKDVLDNEVNSEYFDVVSSDFDLYGHNLEFKDYVSDAYSFFKSLEEGLPNLKDFFDQKLDYKNLAKCFYPDTFALLFAKIIYEYCLSHEKEGRIPNAYTYLMFYKKAIEEMIKTDKKYDPRITYILPSGAKLRRYSRWDFQKEYHSLIDRHQEIKEISLPSLNAEEKDRYKDISFMEKYNHLYDDDVTLNWRLLPEGKRIKQGNVNISRINSSDNKKSIEERIKEVNERIKTLESSGYIGLPRVSANQCFAGYYAFFYPNGIVVLEKFWESEEELIPAKYNATYVMNIDNFLEMSKMPKIDLMEYIKNNPDNGVKRIYHSSYNYWQVSLNEAINNPNLEDKINMVVDFIKNMGSEGKTHE